MKVFLDILGIFIPVLAYFHGALTNNFTAYVKGLAHEKRIEA